MKRLKPSLLITACLFLASCEGHLSSSLRRDIALEHDRLRDADRQLQRTQDMVRSDLAKNPDLFRSVSAPGEWTATLGAAKGKLDKAKRDDHDLQELIRRDHANSHGQAERILNEERKLRTDALQQTQSVVAAANKWLDFSRDPASNLARMKQQYDAIRGVDLGSIATTVEKAEKDWPSKKAELEKRWASLQSTSKATVAEWDSTEAARQAALGGQVNSQQVETLVRVDQELSSRANALTGDSNELRLLCGQLYDSWDKVLTDLDSARYGGDQVFRERIKTVRTHLTDVAGTKGETSSDERWINTSEASYRAIENDLGMTIAHKDAGLFDSEADTTPQPAGFAYIAPASQERNQYGYWAHTDHGTFWTFLPQYLLMRELLWNRDYRPVVVDDFNAYRTARRAGRIYYGQQTPASPPQYGTHGSFTQTRYAQSRYAQSGGFKNSSYASHREGGSTQSYTRPRSAEHPTSFGTSSGSAGKRFGSPSGQRFGQSSGSRSVGRSFGRRR
jgi:hypothetical protein